MSEDRITESIINRLTIMNIPIGNLMDEAVDVFENHIEDINFHPTLNCTAFINYIGFRELCFGNENAKRSLYLSDPMFSYWALYILLHKYSCFDSLDNVLKLYPNYDENNKKLIERAVNLIVDEYEDFKYTAGETDLWLENPPCFIWREFEGARCPFEEKCMFKIAQDDDDNDFEIELFSFNNGQANK